MPNSTEKKCQATDNGLRNAFLEIMPDYMEILLKKAFMCYFTKKQVELKHRVT